LACGTGSTASAYVGWMTGKLKRKVIVKTRGGILQIEGRKTEVGEEIRMKGPAKMVFNGTIF
jgi:diaminopimelate epimerase